MRFPGTGEVGNGNSRTGGGVHETPDPHASALPLREIAKAASNEPSAAACIRRRVPMVSWTQVLCRKQHPQLEAGSPQKPVPPTRSDTFGGLCQCAIADSVCSPSLRRRRNSSAQHLFRLRVRRKLTQII